MARIDKMTPPLMGLPLLLFVWSHLTPQGRYFLALEELLGMITTWITFKKATIFFDCKKN
jgi:hypothetical protein